MRTEIHPVDIVADDRENASGVMGELRGRPAEVRLVVRRLEVGDFEVGENIVVERKTVRDFAASVVDARLFRQAAALAWSGRRGVLILEAGGEVPAGMTREAMQGALITVSVFYGLAVLRARAPEETARLLLYLGRQERRFARQALPRRGRRPKGKRARQDFVLQGLPGVGPRRAEALLGRFGSIERIAQASAEELSSVPGIGECIATKMRWVLEDSAP